MKYSNYYWVSPFVFLGIFLYSCKVSPVHKVSKEQSTIELTIVDSPGFLVPADFTGISFESDAALPNHRGVKGYLFSPDNKELINLFVNSGIRNLRVGGGTVDMYHGAAYDHAAIDNLFGFAKAAGIKVIYSLPLLNASDTADADAAKYIWANYRDLLDCFSIGNEPNEPPYKEAKVGAIKTYPEYISIWKTFAKTILNKVPGAKFAGPDAGGWNWTEEFARDEKSSGLIIFITHHQYPGGKPVINNKPITSKQAIDSMLSPIWLTGEYNNIYRHTGEKVAPYGFSCRMTEANDYLGGIDGASNAMSSALWALDYMHWQALRGLSGIDFHNNQWLKTCTIYLAPSGDLFVNPKAYAIRAFDLVSGGYTEPVILSNPKGVNLTAYAIKRNDYLYVTIINKGHEHLGGNVHVAISTKDFTKGKASAMFLTSPGNDVGAMKGITLGGDSITNHRSWGGQWALLGKERKGRYDLNMPQASAVIVRIPLH